jgi:proliferating cell nuclear antigen PCNA
MTSPFFAPPTKTPSKRERDDDEANDHEGTGDAPAATTKAPPVQVVKKSIHDVPLKPATKKQRKAAAGQLSVADMLGESPLQKLKDADLRFCATIRGGGTAQLSRIVDVLKDLISDMNIDCFGTYMNLQSYDDSHTSVAHARLKSSWWERYFVSSAVGVVTLGMNLKRLMGVLKRFDKPIFRVTLYQLHHQNENVTFLVEERVGPRWVHSCNYEMKLLDIESDDVMDCVAQWQLSMRLASSELKEILLRFGGSEAIFECSATEVTIQGEGEWDRDVIRTHCRAPDPEDVAAAKASPDDPVPIKYHIEWLGDVNPFTVAFAIRFQVRFAAAAAASKFVTISLGDNAPYRAVYELDDDGSFCTFYLAPRETIE